MAQPARARLSDFRRRSGARVETGTAGGGGFTGVVIGAGKCRPTGFAATVTLNGTSTLFERVLVDFGTPIDEASLFSAPPPPCSGTCPSPSPSCDMGAPSPVTPLADVLRVQIGAASPPPEVCGTSFLHFATGEFFLAGSWPP